MRYRMGFRVTNSEHDLAPRPTLPMPMVYERAEPPRWAYRVVTVDLREEPPLQEDQLNELGGEGWILASTISQPAGSSARLTYYFVRSA